MTCFSCILFDNLTVFYLYRFQISFLHFRWSRKSQKQIPAARAVAEDNNVLIIRHANPEDQDVYICTAENSAGAIHTSAQVQVNCKYLSFYVRRLIYIYWNCYMFKNVC